MSEEKTYDLTQSYLYPIVRLESSLSSRMRARLYRITVGFLLTFLTLILAIAAANYFNLLDKNMLSLQNFFLPKIFGLVVLMFACWIVMFSLEAFFRSFYFKEREDATINGRDRIPEDMFSFSVLRILLSVRGDDITGAFVVSPVGREILYRAGVRDEGLESFFSNRQNVIVYPFPPVSMTGVFSLIDLSGYIFEHDNAFADFLFSQGVQKDDLLGATLWVAGRKQRAKQAKRWWVAENLERVGSIGADWAYGQAYILKRYAQELNGHEKGASFNALSEKGVGYLRQMKDLLSRERESNVLLVGNPGEGEMDIVYAFARELRSGEAPAQLAGKRPMLFDGAMLVSNTKNKGEFETTLIRILNDTTVAGNIILIFRNFPAFILSARQIGSDVMSFMDPFFASSGVQVIAITDKDNYHQLLEQDPTIKQRFERIIVERPEDNEMVEVLQKVADELEVRSGVLFTYGCLRETVKAVYDHFSDPVMPDKAIDILIELPAHVIRKHKRLVEKEDVYEIVGEKTGVPLGAIGSAEKDALLGLEEELHKRVVGQEEAVRVVSNAMRRSRAGVRNTKRPIGSFLFVGPTGVGKTETAKALAQIFFGDENKMTRLDMSEFNGEDAVARLIGSFDAGKVGVLPKALSEHPYGVVLLDEFEKSSKDVHDLFLQILDEGFFSDVRGKRVNARDVIFIATSNAGSPLIFKRMEEGADMNLVQKEVINYIISEQIFKPEFLNRFDAVVLFHPLGLSHIQQISKLMLDKLKTRLRGHGLDLNVTDELADHVAHQGLDPVFGARPMNRYIQEHVEQVVAEKLIRGDIKEGSRFTLAPEDLG